MLHMLISPIMKKAILIFVLLFVVASLQLQAKHPIPSYNVPLKNAANFQEKHNNKMGSDFGAKYKRDLDVRTYVVPPSHMPIIYVWVYSLDMRDVLGPFTMVGNDFLEVEIDGREWGVVTQCDDKVYVSVWISGAVQLMPDYQPGINLPALEEMNVSDLTNIFLGYFESGDRNKNVFGWNRS